MARKVHTPPKLSRLAMALIAGAAVLLPAVILAAPARAAANFYAVAFMGSNYDLWYNDGISGAHDTNIGMDPESSPSMTFDTSGRYEIAFVSLNETLSIYQPASGKVVDTGLSVWPGTNPSIAANGVVAYEGLGGDLWYWDGTGHDTHLGMFTVQGGPSISSDGAKIAFEADTSNLWVYDVKTRLGVNSALGMNGWTSPSIGRSPDDSYWVAFEANTNILWYYDTTTRLGIDSGLQMEPDTSPGIDPSGSGLIAYPNPANRLNVYNASTKANTATLLGLTPYAAPSIGPIINSTTGQVTDYRAWFEANGSDDLYYFSMGDHSSGNVGSMVNPFTLYESYVSPAAGVPIYASLGDSYSAGEGDGNYDAGTDTSSNNCHRSSLAFGRQYAASLGLAVMHIACSGATMPNIMTTGQNGEPSQLSQLSPLARIVTITIGGNDAGFAAVLTHCLLRLGCQSYYTQNDANNLDNVIESLRPQLANVYRAVKNKAPKAEVVAVTYPNLFKLNQTCLGIGNLGSSDVNWLNSETNHLDTVIGEAAGDAGISQLDLRGIFAGHQICDNDPWAFPLPIPNPVGQVTDRSAWFHPTATGQALMAQYLNSFLGFAG